MFIKKNVGRFLFLLMFINFMFGFNIKFVCADNRYYIDDYEQKIKINIDGSADFEEKMVYVFNGKFNGIYFNLDYRDCGNFEDYSVSILDNNKEVVLKQNSSHEKNSYELNFNDDIAYFKIFSPSRSERKTFVFRYKLSQPVKKLKDAAQFNRKLISDNFKAEVKKFNALISFESDEVDRDKLRIFAHGPLNGESKIYENGTVGLEINNLPARNFVETNLIFDSLYVNDLEDNAIDLNLDKILKREEKLAMEANRIRENARLKRKIIFISLGLGALGFLFYVAYVIIKNEKYYDKHFKDDYYRELPGDYTPAEMSALFMNLGAKDITATLLDLFRQKIISITFIQEKNDYEIKMIGNKTRLNKRVFESEEKYLTKEKSDFINSQGLKSHEKYLLNWFINEIGDTQKVRLSDIKKYNKFDISHRFYYKYLNWIDDVKTTAQNNNNFFRDDAPFIFYKRYSRTKEYQIEYEKWLAFKRYLKDFSDLESAEVDSIILWEKYLVFAVSLNIAKHVLKNIKLKFSTETLENKNLVMINFLSGRNNILNFNSGIEKVITRSVYSVRSSTSGEGGGFSGGSSCGSGGHGGGGAF